MKQIIFSQIGYIENEIFLGNNPFGYFFILSFRKKAIEIKSERQNGRGN